MKGFTVKTPERVAEAQQMRAAGKLIREIAEHFNVGKTTVASWLADPDGSQLKARKRRYDLECVQCGGRVYGCNPSRMADPSEPVCASCASEFYAVWTREAIIFALQEWADDHGGIPPTANDVWRARARGDQSLPNVNHIQYRFGSWNDGLRAAGFEPHLSGSVGGYTPLTEEQRKECARRYALGESSTSIAADFGCSPRMVTKWARRAGVPIRPGFAQRKEAA